jgi:hypothetical protein
LLEAVVLERARDFAFPFEFDEEDAPTGEEEQAVGPPDTGAVVELETDRAALFCFLNNTLLQP